MGNDNENTEMPSHNSVEENIQSTQCNICSPKFVNSCITCPTYCCNDQQFSGRCNCSIEDSWVNTCRCYKPGVLRFYDDYRSTPINGGIYKLPPYLYFYGNK